MTAGWEHQAACRNAPDPDIFFNAKRANDAKRYCSRCPVVLACREAGQTAYRGVWAGEYVMRTTTGPSPSAPYLPTAHGNEAGYSRHIYNGEEPCRQCRLAHAAYQREKATRTRESA